MPDELQTLRAALAAGRELVAASAHDLRAPLQTVSGFLELLLLDAGERLLPEEQERIERARRALAGMHQIIADLVGWARALDLRTLAPGRLDQALDQALLEIGDAAATASIERDLQPLPALRMDSGTLSRVLRNLLLNALRFVPPTQGRIAIEASLEPDGGHALLTVRDNGPGVPPAERERVFELFYGDGDGSGIGLAFCRHALRACGGEIWFEDDTAGEGARIRLRLPLAGG